MARNGAFENGLPLDPYSSDRGFQKVPDAVFRDASLGVTTKRDAWVYSFSRETLNDNIDKFIDSFNAESSRGVRTFAELTSDRSRIEWTLTLKKLALAGVQLKKSGDFRPSLYRPFTKQWLYYDELLNDKTSKTRVFYPDSGSKNRGLLVLKNNQRASFAVIATDLLPDNYTFEGATQYFPRFTYEPDPQRDESQTSGVPGDEVVDGYRRIDNISDNAHARFQQAFGPLVTKDQIFAYVYAVLHSEQYREQFASLLKKKAPRIPLAKDLQDFRAFAEAGQRLMDLHIGYESVKPYPLQVQTTTALGMDAWELYAVGDKRMKFSTEDGVEDKTTLVYNSYVTLSDIPKEAYRYQLGWRSALEWVVNSYYIETDEDSGIVNDPNAWSRKVGNPRYILDLIGRVIAVSLKTMRIIDQLPHLPLDGEEPVAFSPVAIVPDHTVPQEAPDESPREAHKDSQSPDSHKNTKRSAASKKPAAPKQPQDPDAVEWLDFFRSLQEDTKTAWRDWLMVEGVRAGLTLQEVGDLYGVSRERVRQIAAMQGVNTRQLREEKKQQQERHQRRVNQRIYAVSLEHPELTIEELAEWAEADEDTVRKALRHRRAVHEVTHRDWTAGTTDDELIDGLQRWAAESNNHTGDSYTEWAVVRGLPGKQTAMIRFGGWNNALRHAGLDHLVQDRGGRRPEMSDEVLWAALLQFFRDDVENYSYDGYEQYWKPRGFPSAATIRARLGGWNDVKERIRELMRYAVAPDGNWEWAEAVLAVHPEQHPRNVASKEKSIEALREVGARTTGPLTVALYEEHRAPTHPSAAVVQSRCGLWINALHEAGLTDRMSTRAQQRWKEQERLKNREDS